MDYAVETVKNILKEEKPLFGICLGHQLLALAKGIPTFKMHHGHRGLNHPVKNLITGKCEITTQNHGFGVDPDSVRKNQEVEVTHINLNDDSYFFIPFIILIILSCSSSLLSCNCLSLCLSLLLIGDILNAIPQRRQNTVSWQ